jgi:hypothetical protein
LGEELIQVVDDTDPIHDAFLSALGVRGQVSVRQCHVDANTWVSVE